MLGLTIYGVKESFGIYQKYQYQKTYEYKINQVGYSKKQTAILIKKLSDKNLDYLLNQEFNESYYNIVNQKYFLEKNFNSYIEYYNYHQILLCMKDYLFHN